MANSNITHRHYLIIEKIKEGQYPSRKEIEDYLLRNGHHVESRTIDDDFNNIRTKYGIEIQYNRSKNGYSINIEDSIEDINSFIRFLEIVNTADILTNSLKENSNALKYISFDAGGGFKNIKSIQPLLKAITNSLIITFDYTQFHNTESEEYSIEPYFLKEYQNRWYVVGQINNTDKIRTFGIDRIAKLQLTKNKFKENKKIKPLEDFSKTIGLVYSDGIEAQEVILMFTHEKGQYIKTLPLHSTQKILIDNKNEFRVSLYVIPNNDLTELILKHGDSVEVIEPKWLVDEVKEKLTNALNRYLKK